MVDWTKPLQTSHDPPLKAKLLVKLVGDGPSPFVVMVTRETGSQFLIGYGDNGRLEFADDDSPTNLVNVPETVDAPGHWLIYLRYAGGDIAVTAGGSDYDHPDLVWAGKVIAKRWIEPHSITVVEGLE